MSTYMVEDTNGNLRTFLELSTAVALAASGWVFAVTDGIGRFQMIGSAK